ncbi:MAG: sodium/solute symporter [bacterium]|nr:sodium/solute symporter [bacterium]
MRATTLWAICSVLLTGTAAAGEATADRGLEWEKLTDLPSPMSGQFVGVAKVDKKDDVGQLVIAGGTFWPKSPFQGGTKQWFNTVYSLAPDADTWTPGAELPHAVAYGAGVSCDGSVICAGGADGDRHYADVFKLSWQNDRIEWTELPSLPRTCAYTDGALVGTTMYVAGGQESPDSTEALHTFWALDLSQPDDALAWKELDPWPGPARILPVVAAQGGKVYVFSGADLAAGPDGKAARTYLTDGYCFTPDGPGVLYPGWKAVTGPPKGIVAAPSVAVGPSHIFAFSGDDGALVDQIAQLGDNHPGFTKDALAYHTITDTWVVRGSIPESLVTTSAVMWQGRIVVPGGEDRPGNRCGSVYSGVVEGSPGTLGALDLGVMALYFAVLVAMGFYFSKREKTTEDFFLGGRRVPWWAAGLSIYGTLLSAITFLTTPATTFSLDWRFYVSTLMMVFTAPIVAYVYLPFFRRTNITTAYEYLEKRFNPAVRMFGSCAFILFQLGRVGIVILLPALALSAATNINLYFAIALMGVLCTIYTVMGGIEAVIWTDVLQVFILLGGVIISLFIVVFSVDGGFSGVVSEGWGAGKFRIAHWGWDMTSQVLCVVVAGRFLETLIPYTTDQTVVQRYLTTATEKDARKSIFFGMICSIPNSLLFFGLGTALYVFYRANPQLLDPNLKTDAIVPLFIVQQLPTGIAGLVIAAVFAAAMSSLDSSLNSVSAVVVTDFYRRLKPDTSEKSALLVARVLTVIVGVLGTGMALIMAVSDIQSLWQHYMKIIGLFGGGLAGLFALGIFTRRGSGAGALLGAAAGACVLFYVQRGTNISFLLYSTIGITVSLSVGYVASMFLPGDGRDLAGLTWWTRNAKPANES